MKRKLLVSTVILSMFMVACGDDYFFIKSKAFEDQQWAADTPKGFTFQVEDTTSLYSFILNIRNTTDYEYQNLYLFMTTTYPDQSSSRDTMEILLAKRSGEWLGKGSGYYRDNLVLFKKNVSLPEPGNYRIEFVQAMREDTLQGVDEIGLRILQYNPQS
ncbi:MAG: gliding motility lipoprotein GldH [Bacteroidales bacterium]